MKFMLMMNAPRGKGGDWDVVNWTQDELKAHIGHMDKLHKELSNEGVLVAAEGLAPPSQARLVRATKGAAHEVTDGPFAEAKEFLAGYWIVDVETPEQAYAIAGRASVAPGPGRKPLNMPIEIRQVMSGPPVDP